MPRKLMIDNEEVSEEKTLKLLSETIERFYEDKQNLDSFKKLTEEENKQIKEVMSNLNKSEFETDSGIIAKVNIQKRESFVDDKLIAKLKDLGVTTPIKTIEVVDMDELENVIYNGDLDASELSSCKQVKEVAVLKVSKKKGE